MSIEHEQGSFFYKIFLLRQIPIFQGIGWIDLHYIASRSVLMRVGKGELVYRRGDPPDAFYCVIFGRLLAYHTQERQATQSQEYIYRGMHFGIISLLTGEPHSLNFEALNDSLLVRIPQEPFKEILNRIPRLGVRLSYSLSRRMKDREQIDKKVFESTVISIYSPRQGTGSSFYALHLAIQLKKETKKQVLFVEISRSKDRENPQEDSFTPRLKAEPHAFEEVVKNVCNINQFLLKSSDGFPDVFRMTFDSSALQLSSYLSRVITSLAHQYHYVIFDLPNAMDRFVFSATAQSDEVHLIAKEHQDDFHDLQQFIKKLQPYFKEAEMASRVKIFIKENPNKKKFRQDKISRIINYDIYGKLPYVRTEEIENCYHAEFFSLGFPFLQHPFHKEVRKIAREIGGVRICLVLGGGAALGLSHIGVLDVLEKEQIPVDLVVGSSIGSVIASFWALGKTAREIECFAKEFRSRSRCLTLIDIIFPRSGLIGGNQIQRWLRKKMGNAIFYQTTIPLKMTAYDIIKREEIVLGSGDIVDAIRKSISIPGIMRPVACKEHVFLDGGIFNPLPTNVPASMGIRKIIAVNILKSPEDVQRDYECFHSKKLYRHSRWGRFLQRRRSFNIFDILINSFLSIDYTLADLSAQQADVLIHPDSTGIHWYEFYKAEELIEKGRQATYSVIKEIRAMMES